MNTVTWNMWFNSITQAGLLTMLATEGLKCSWRVHGSKIEGKAAWWLFVVLSVFTTAVPQTEARSVWYFINGVLHLLALVGIYSFISRLYRALEHGSRDKP